MAKYIEIAKKYLVKDSKILTKELCFTIRKRELDSSANPEELIKSRLGSICYDFSKVRGYIDAYGMESLLFYNDLK